jgi:hypothetical protein
MRQSVCLRTASFEEGATVSTRSILSWVLTATTRLLSSQSKTLAVLVAAAIRCERPNLAQVGRKMAGPITAKSAIKRAWRFTCNERIEVADGMAEIIAKLVRKRKKRLLVSFDWTEFRRFHTLMAGACIKGRSVPLLRASYPEWKLLRSQNSMEEGLLRLLRTSIPESIRVVIPADRGFGRAEWAASCQELSFDYLVRIKPNVTVAGKRYRGVLSHYPVFKGIAHVSPFVRWFAVCCAGNNRGGGEINRPRSWSGIPAGPWPSGGSAGLIGVARKRVMVRSIGGPFDSGPNEGNSLGPGRAGPGRQRHLNLCFPLRVSEQQWPGIGDQGHQKAA